MNVAPYVLLYLAPAAISAGLAIYGWQRRDVRSATPFSLLMAAVVFWSVCHALSVASTTLADVLFWAQLQYGGIVLVGPLWLLFALAYTDGWARNTLALRLALLVAAALTYLAVLTNGWHELWWSAISLDSNRPFGSLNVTRELLFWLHFVFGYGCVLLGFALFLRAAVTTPAPYRGQARLVALGALFPLAGNLVHLLGLRTAAVDDPTPFLFAASGLVMGYAALRYQLLDLTPIAQREIFASLPDGLVVLDRRGVVAAINDLAPPLLAADAAPGSATPSSAASPDRRWRPSLLRCSRPGRARHPRDRLQQRRRDPRRRDPAAPALCRWRARWLAAGPARPDRAHQDGAGARSAHRRADSAQPAGPRRQRRAPDRRYGAGDHPRADRQPQRRPCDDRPASARRDTDAPGDRRGRWSAAPTLEGQALTDADFPLLPNILRARQAQAINISDAALAGTPTEAILRREGLGTVLIVPLYSQAEPLGAMFVGHTSERRITAEEARLFETVGELVAEAILRTQLYDQAQEASRAKSAFLATVSHELRTPLTSIIGFTAMLDHGTFGLPPERAYEPLAHMRRNSQRLLRLINDILDFSKHRGLTASRSTSPQSRCRASSKTSPA